MANQKPNERKFWDDVDDKTLVIVAVFLLCTMAMFLIDDPVNILTTGIAGLLGVAVGKAIK